MRYWTEERRLQTAGAFLADVHAVKQYEKEKAKSSDLPGGSLNLLIKAGLEPGKNLLDMYDALGLHPAEGKAAQEDLVARGFVRVQRLVRKGRGGQPQVLEVTKEGEAVLAARGISLAPRVVKGGFKHDCYARLIAEWAVRRMWRHTFERTLGEKTFDLVLEDDQGRLHGVEVCLSGTAEWTAQQLLKAVAVPGVAEVMALFETSAFQRAVQKEFEKLSPLGLYAEKLKVELLAEFMD